GLGEGVGAVFWAVVRPAEACPGAARRRRPRRLARVAKAAGPRVRRRQFSRSSAVQHLFQGNDQRTAQAGAGNGTGGAIAFRLFFARTALNVASSWPLIASQFATAVSRSLHAEA